MTSDKIESLKQEARNFKVGEHSHHVREISSQWLARVGDLILEALEELEEEKRCLAVHRICSQRLADERDSLKQRIQVDIHESRQQAARLADVCRERDSLKEELKRVRAIATNRLESLEITGKERDSLKAELKAAVCAPDHNRECIRRLVVESDSVKADWMALAGERDRLKAIVRELYQSGLKFRKAAEAEGIS